MERSAIWTQEKQDNTNTKLLARENSWTWFTDCDQEAGTVSEFREVRILWMYRAQVLWQSVRLELL